MPADHNRVAEVGNAFDETDEKGVGQSRLEQWQSDSEESLLAVGVQDLRGFFKAWCQSLYDTAHDHEGDRREGEQLRDPGAEEAVEPACRRDIESVFEKLVDDPGAPEEQDQAEAHDEWWRDDRQQGDDAKRCLDARSCVTFGQQCHHRAEDCCAKRAGQREEQGVPGNTALNCAGKAAQAPDACVTDADEHG